MTRGRRQSGSKLQRAWRPATGRLAPGSEIYRGVQAARDGSFIRYAHGR